MGIPKNAQYFFINKTLILNHPVVLRAASLGKMWIRAIKRNNYKISCFGHMATKVGF